MRALKRNPALLFHPKIKQALQNEVDYCLPQAAWAAHLLKLLERYERRQRKQMPGESSVAITSKYIVWQEQRIGQVIVI